MRETDPDHGILWSQILWTKMSGVWKNVEFCNNLSSGASCMFHQYGSPTGNWTCRCLWRPKCPKSRLEPIKFGWWWDVNSAVPWLSATRVINGLIFNPRMLCQLMTRRVLLLICYLIFGHYFLSVSFANYIYCVF